MQFSYTSGGSERINSGLMCISARMVSFFSFHNPHSLAMMVGENSNTKKKDFNCYPCICCANILVFALSEKEEASFFKDIFSFTSFPFSRFNMYVDLVIDISKLCMWFFSAFILYERLPSWKGKVNFLLAFFHVCEGFYFNGTTHAEWLLLWG